jgi:uncharacterized protein (DUF924 family)
MFEDVLRFWFAEIDPAQWWKVDPSFDAAIRERFGELHRSAHLGELWEWRTEPRGRLAEVIVLDQFSRNVYRGTARAFSSDSMALALAQEAVAGSHDSALSPQERVFIYMPYQHSESRVVHVQAERLFRALALSNHYEYELRHKAIIDRFGRYPHRNAALDRESSPEELQFLRQPGSRF